MRDPVNDPTHAQLHMLRMMIRDRQQDRRFRLVRLVLVALVPVIAIAGTIGTPNAASEILAGLSSRGPELAIVHLNGNVGSGSARADLVVPALRAAFDSDKVRVIALMIDSGGGSPIDAERIDDALAALKWQHAKPVIAVINSLGASAAYLVAMHADEVMAGRFSLVGSIGAVIESWDFSGALGRVDVKQRVYASGALKAMLNPYIPATPAADHKAQALVSVLAGEFLGELERTRGAKLSKGVKYDTGEVWDGEAAERIGLVDTIGTIEDLQVRLQQQYQGIHMHDFGPNSPPATVGLSASVAAEFRQLLSSINVPSVE
ncbi:S49 family peptidase [Burkholderia gladioli]|nr:S49 family peptidase [Burkholderia gladioli]